MFEDYDKMRVRYFDGSVWWSGCYPKSAESQFNAIDAIIEAINKGVQVLEVELIPIGGEGYLAEWVDHY